MKEWKMPGTNDENSGNLYVFCDIGIFSSDATMEKDTDMRHHDDTI